MPNHIAIFTAWPHTGDSLHPEQIAGIYLPADIFARYQRLNGNSVLMVSGTNAHGTPALSQWRQKDGESTKRAKNYHYRFLEAWMKIGITFDLFTHTGAVLQQLAQDIFNKLYIQDDIRKGEKQHYLLNLPAYQHQLETYLESRPHWHEDTRLIIKNWLRKGLEPHSVTCEMEQGIKAPVGCQEKAPVLADSLISIIGCLSASQEWATLMRHPMIWKMWWQNERARSYYFISKAALFSHGIVWPAILRAYDRRLHLPDEIRAAHDFRLDHKPFSSIEQDDLVLPDILDKIEPDLLRYCLSAIAPKADESHLIREALINPVNTDSIAAWSRLVTQVLTAAWRHFKGRVPMPGPFNSAENALLSQIGAAFKDIGQLYETGCLKEALERIMTLVEDVNTYWNSRGQESAGAVFAALRAIDSLKVLLAPVLPHSAEKLHRALGYSDPLFGQLLLRYLHKDGQWRQLLTYLPSMAESLFADRWKPSQLPVGRQLKPFEPLFDLIKTDTQ